MEDGERVDSPDSPYWRERDRRTKPIYDRSLACLYSSAHCKECVYHVVFVLVNTHEGDE